MLYVDLAFRLTGSKVPVDHGYALYSAISRVVPEIHEAKSIGLRLLFLSIEVKGIGSATGTVLLTPNERRVAEDRRDCYWLYVVTGCKAEANLQEPIRNPARFPWHEVKKVDHYYLSVDALTQPMQVRDPVESYKTPGIDS